MYTLAGDRAQLRDRRVSRRVELLLHDGGGEPVRRRIERPGRLRRGGRPRNRGIRRRHPPVAMRIEVKGLIQQRTRPTALRHPHQQVRRVEAKLLLPLEAAGFYNPVPPRIPVILCRRRHVIIVLQAHRSGGEVVAPSEARRGGTA